MLQFYRNIHAKHRNGHTCASSQYQAISFITCGLGTRLGSCYLPGLQLPCHPGRYYLLATLEHSECISITNRFDQILNHGQPLFYCDCFIIYEPDHIGSHCIVLLMQDSRNRYMHTPNHFRQWKVIMVELILLKEGNICPRI